MIDILLKQMGFKPDAMKAQLETALLMVNSFDHRLTVIQQQNVEILRSLHHDAACGNMARHTQLQSLPNGEHHGER